MPGVEVAISFRFVLLTIFRGSWFSRARKLQGNQRRIVDGSQFFVLSKVTSDTEILVDVVLPPGKFSFLATFCSFQRFGKLNCDFPIIYFVTCAPLC